MTLFCLDNNIKTIRRNFFIYIGVTIFCVAFGIIYETYSHGVVSHFTLYGFVWPFVLGLLPYSVLFLKKSEKGPGELCSCIYNAGVATLTVGSYFKGMLDIYGTTRDVYVITYFVVGFSLLGIGIIIYIISLLRSGETKDK